MSRFDRLRRTLVRDGVAPHHATNLAVELADHERCLIDEERARGESDHAARHAALRRLGSLDEIARAYTARAELRSRVRRHQITVFLAIPLPTLVVTKVAALAAALALVSAGSAAGVPIGTGLVAPLGSAARLGAGVLVAAAYGAIAGRHATSIVWPVMCGALLGLATSRGVAGIATPVASVGEVAFGWVTPSGRSLVGAIIPVAVALASWVVFRPRAVETARP